jgi:hypothetical protein
MSVHVRNVFPILTLLANKKTSKKLLRALINEPAYQQDFFRSIDEIFFNISYGDRSVFRFSPKAKKLLKKYRKIIEKLGHLSKNSSVTNRKLILKYGPILFPVLLPIVVKVLKDLVD